MADCKAFCNHERIKNDIIKEYDHFRVLVPIGPLSEGHVLLSSKGHYECFADMEKEKQTEYATLLRSLCEQIERIYKKDVLVFEHGKFGESVPHAHSQLVPLAEDILYDVLSEINSEISQKYEMDISTFSSTIYPRLKGYVMIQTGGKILWYDAYHSFDQSKLRYVREKISRLTHQRHLLEWDKLSGDEKTASISRALLTKKRLSEHLT